MRCWTQGAKVALLNRKRHRDVLDMREGLKPDRRPRVAATETLCRAERPVRRGGAAESRGSAVIPSTRTRSIHAIAAVKDSGAKAVLCVPAAYINPRTNRAVRFENALLTSTCRYLERLLPQ